MNLISPKLILCLLISILAFHIVATIYYWYWTYSWLDMPMHFFGGFWLAAVFFWLNSKFNIIEIRLFNINCNFWRTGFFELLLSFGLTLGFVALIGILWEFFEFGYDVLISAKGYAAAAQRGTADTISDLFFDLFGGLFFILIFKIFPLIKSTSPTSFDK